MKKYTLFVATFIALNFLFSLKIVVAQTAPDLTITKKFAVLSGGTLADDNPYNVKGYLGANTLSGTHSVEDSTLIGNSEVSDALTELSDEITALFSQGGELLDGIVNENNFTAGVYFIAGNSQITSNSTITFSGDDDDIFIFNIDGDLTIDSNVIFVLNGINPKNIFWNIIKDLQIDKSSEIYGVFLISEDAVVSQNLIGSINLLSLNNVQIKSSDCFTAISFFEREVPTSENCSTVCVYQEKVVGGNFSTVAPLNVPSLGFISYFQYNYYTNSHGDHPQGRFTIAPNAKNYYRLWPDINEYTGDGGNFLIVDGSYFDQTINNNSNRVLWEQTTDVSYGNGAFQFSAAFVNLDVVYDPLKHIIIEFLINGNIVKTITLEENNLWNKYCVDWTRPNGVNSAVLQLRQVINTSSAGGQDYGVDNISFGVKIPHANAGPDRVACYMEPISIGTHPYCGTTQSFSWSPATGLNNPNVDIPTLTPTTTQIYTLTATIDGNVTTDDVLVTVVSSFLCNRTNLSTLPNIYVCPNTTTYVNPDFVVSGGTGIYEYYWQNVTSGFSSTTVKNPQVNLPAGTYIYNVIVKSGDCTRSFVQYVYSTNPTPNAEFTKTNCDEPGKTGFSATYPDDRFTYTWNFGNGLTATGQHVKLPLDGTYNVSLTVSTFCGVSATTNQTHRIFGSYSNYNQGCCLTNQYTYEITSDFNTTSTTTNWSSTSFTNNNINATIFVNSEHTLNITGLTLTFGPLGRIVVKQGGVLNISNSILKGVNDIQYPCIGMWEGIEVWGQDDKTQSVTYQGKLVISGTSEINDAHKAVFVGKRNNCYDLVLTDPETCPPNDPEFEYGFGGGIIDVQGTTFKRNAVDIQFAPYSPKTSQSTNPMVVKGNNFEGGTVRHPSYNSTNSVGATLFPNANNLYYAPANSVGKTSRHIKLYSVKNDLDFQDNVFDNAEYGIDAVDAQFNVTKYSASTGNVFKNMDYGIYITNSVVNSIYPHAIIENNFNKLGVAIHLETGRYDVIKKNTFGQTFSPQSTQSDNPLGIYFNNTAAFNITDNDFFRMGTAIQVSASGNTGGWIDSDPVGNIFTRCTYGVLTTGNNSNLQIRCDKFINSEPAEYINRNWSITGSLADQGTPGDYKTPAGNEFYPEGRRHLFSDASFTYHRHKRGVTVSDESVIPVIASGSSGLTINNTGEVKTNYSCTTEEPCDPCDRPIEDNTAQKQQLENDYEDMLLVLDNNNTSLLLTEVNNFNLNSEQLKNLLITNSPLSDLVVAALLENYNRLTQTHFVQVMDYNLPMSDELWPTMQYLLPSFTSTNADNMVNKQMNANLYPTLTSLERDYVEVINERQQLIAQAVKLEVDTNEAKAMARLLAEENENKQMAVGTYLIKGNTIAAQNYISGISSYDADDADWVELQNISLSLKQLSKNWFDIDSAQQADIRRISLGNGRAASNSQAVLHLVFNEVFPRVIESTISTSSRTTLKKLNNKDTNVENKLLAVYPNPTSQVLNIPYRLNEGNGVIEVRGILGNLIESGIADKGYNLKVIDLAEYPNGIFFVSLKDTLGKTISTQKFSVQH